MPLDISSLLGGNLALLGGGSGSLQNGGVGVGALTGGMAYNRESAGMDANALNQQNQDIQNKLEALKLQEQTKDVPLNEATRAGKLQSAQQDLAAGAEFGTEARASSAKSAIAKNYESMSDSKKKEHENDMRNFNEANDILNNSAFDDTIPEHHEAVAKALRAGGMTDVPDHFGPAEKAKIAVIAKSGQDTLEHIRATQLADAKEANLYKMSKEHNQTLKEVAEITAGKTAADLAKTLSTAKIAEINIQQTGVYTQAEKDIILRDKREKFVASNEYKGLQEDKNKEEARISAKTDPKTLDAIKASAKADGITVPSTFSASETANIVSAAHLDMAVDKRINEDFKKEFSGARQVDAKPDQGVSKKTVGSNPFGNTAATAPAPTASPSPAPVNAASSGKLPRVKVPGGTISGEEALAKGIK